MADLPTFSFHHTGISVPDLEAAIDWYADVLGFAEERRFAVPRAQAKAAFLEREGMRIELFEVDGAAPLPDDRRHPHADLRTHGNKHIAFGVADYDALLTELDARGIEIVLRVGETFGRGLFIRDIVGNVIEFVEISRA